MNATRACCAAWFCLRAVYRCLPRTRGTARWYRSLRIRGQRSQTGRLRCVLLPRKTAIAPFHPHACCAVCLLPGCCCRTHRSSSSNTPVISVHHAAFPYPFVSSRTACRLRACRHTCCTRCTFPSRPVRLPARYLYSRLRWRNSQFSAARVCWLLRRACCSRCASAPLHHPRLYQ